MSILFNWKNLLIFFLLILSLYFFKERSVEQTTTSSTEFTPKLLRTEYEDKLDRQLNYFIKKGNSFPLFDIVTFHKHRMKELEASGYSSKYFRQVFKDWLFDKYGIDIENDLVKKLSQSYHIDVKKFKNYELSHFDKKENVQIYQKRSSNDYNIKIRPNILIPKGDGVKYHIEGHKNPIKITPVLHTR